MKPPSFGEAVGALLALIATGVIAWAVIGQQNAIALGALIAVIAAANGFFLRAKVQPTTDPNAPTQIVVPPKAVLVDERDLPPRG